MKFTGGLEKSAISVGWSLDRIRGGVKSRAGVMPGTVAARTVDNLTKTRFLDRAIRATPKDNLPILQKLKANLKKSPESKQHIRYLMHLLGAEQKRVLK